MTSIDSTHLQYIIEHVFLPPKLPQEYTYSVEKDHALAQVTYDLANEFLAILSAQDGAKWNPLVKMLDAIRTFFRYSTLSQVKIAASIQNMRNSDVLAFLVRAQNAGLIIRKSSDAMVFEMFEISPTAKAVMEAIGKLKCSFPGPAVRVPSEISSDPHFLAEIALFLSHMDHEEQPDAVPHITKAQSTVPENRDTAEPRYVTELLTGILRGLGEPAEVNRICKRIADDVLLDEAVLPWRRSSLWLLIRVALQTSLSQESSAAGYKQFMLFLTTRILKKAVHHDMDSDIIHIMRVKVNRRSQKLGAAIPQWLVDEVVNALQMARDLLQKRWEAIQQQEKKISIENFSPLNCQRDTIHSLSFSRQYITHVLTRHLQTANEPFSPSDPPRLQDVRKFDTYGKRLTKAFAVEPYVALMDFEQSVRRHLDAWVSDNLCNEGACRTIADCIKSYASAAKKYYQPNTEDFSLMLLTIFDLWVALDRMVVAQCPLLRAYSPEVKPELLESLLLSKFEHLERLAYIERYLRDRQGGKSVFSDRVDDSTFAVRFFQQSSGHARLLEKIHSRARQDRDKKIAELQSANRRHSELMNEASLLDHDYYMDRYGQRTIHSSCQKCRLEGEAQGMTVSVHEWPLPSHDKQAQVVVFELSLPENFGIWRTTTYKILHDICVPSSRRSTLARFPTRLHNYPGLHDFFEGSEERITLASETTSFLSSHYREQHLPAEEGAICVDNGLRYKLFDTHNQQWVAGGFHPQNLAGLCNLQLPSGPYKFLQYAVDDTNHTSNQMLANQSDCSEALTIHEYIAFAGLRAGERLQWLNILRELRTRDLTFSRKEVFILLVQAVSQVGASLNGGRESHVELSSHGFCISLLNELGDLLSSIQENWLENMSARTITALVSRLLASQDDISITERAYALLRRVRVVTLTWMRQLVSKIHHERYSEEFQRLACEVAATCKATYDVDQRHLLRVFHSSDDIATLIECDIVVHENSPVFARDVVLDKHRRISHAVESVLARLINSNHFGLDQGIKAVWPAFQRGSPWERMNAPNNRWFFSHTTGSANSRPQPVHYNILSGLFLIDGKPLGRLPSYIVNHGTFQRIFGQRVLTVVPADMDGMEFAAQYEISGNKVYFAFQKEHAELIIRAVHDGQIYELIPAAKLLKDFPSDFVTNNAHWINISTRRVEFRPLSSLWVSSDKNWHLTFSPDNDSFMQKEDVFLVDIRSPTFSTISDILSPLEQQEYISVTYKGFLLTAELPRFNLSFFLNEGKRLECRNYRELVVDDNQCMGTMFGLLSKLVLYPKDPHDKDPRRMVIIPFGRVEFHNEGHHVTVTIVPSSTGRIIYETYRIDTDLGCLAESTSIRGTFFKVLLHSVTAFCLPDPLMGRTGTEEALSELSSATSFSFQRLGTSEIELLHEIGSLTPQRQFYPPFISQVQTIKWTCLRPTAQHNRFCALINDVLRHANDVKIFEPCDTTDTSGISRGDGKLLARAEGRSGVFYPGEFAGPNSLVKPDVEYIHRDFLNGTSREALIAGLSYTLQRPHNHPSLKTCSSLVEAVRPWGKIEGPTSDLGLFRSVAWLRPDFAQTWLNLYQLCSSDRGNTGQYNLIFALSMIAYTKDDGQFPVDTLLDTLVAFAKYPQFRSIQPPRISSYCLSDGFEPHPEKLSAIVRTCVLPFSGRGTNFRSLEHQGKQFELDVKFQTDYVVNFLIAQWPCDRPSLPAKSSIPLLKLLEVHDEIKQIFKSRYHNLQLRDFLDQVQLVLNGFHSPLSSIALHVSVYQPCFETFAPRSDEIDIRLLLTRPAPSIGTPPAVMEQRSKNDVTDLRSLLLKLPESHELYRSDLLKSCDALEMQDNLNNFPPGIPYHGDLLEQSRDEWERYIHKVVANIREALAPQTKFEHMTRFAGVWPRFTPRSLLGNLSAYAGVSLTDSWKQVLIGYGQGLVNLHRAQRLVALARHKSFLDFSQELHNAGFDKWSPSDFPDWLLIQLENRFIMRSLQTEVAMEMMFPRSKRNSVTQLIMGEGKSSVIIPIIAAALADGKKLVRVVVLKQLASSMFRLLAQRLSGLTNRRIFYLPFSRSVCLDPPRLDIIRRMYEECMRIGGIVLTQPEHMLSFKLMGLDRLYSGDALAKDIVNTQQWLEQYSRDILDESDEILHVRYQLIYAVGNQQPVDDRPDRWGTMQQLLSLVKEHAPIIHQDFPHGIEVLSDGKKGSFPSIRIIESDAGEQLVSSIINSLRDGNLYNLQTLHFPSHLREAAFAFIKNLDVSPERARILREYCGHSTLWKTLLLLRGLLAHGVLLFVLRKRWRVEYGLYPRRSLLAVPYRAKDCPSLRAEFGHPDVTLGLTCLSYYYGGLSDDQIDLCFDLLYKLDNPTVEYQRWLRHQDLDGFPEGLRSLNGVNIKNPEQRSRYLIPLFRLNHATIDFFLALVVFPQQAKQFPQRLTTSSWDIAAKKAHLVTGFSGTNDNRYLLPSSIIQCDLPQQSCTNATLLNYILQPKNNHYACLGDDHRSRVNVDFFLDVLIQQSPPIRILLDVGAQMLELQNCGLAKAWLSRVPSAIAAVFFDDNDELQVLYQDGTLDAFISSPFSKNLGECLVYLDDHHTRGTDLKFPPGSRAAVTLGPRLTKDRLLQACMRMRKLGVGEHSVMFFAPPEIDWQIRCSVGKDEKCRIESSDVLRWSMLETYKDIENNATRWARQGLEFKARSDSWTDYSTHAITAEFLMRHWLQPEAKTLEEMYGCDSRVSHSAYEESKIHAFLSRLNIATGSISHGEMEAEQEREVAAEAECERQTERPPKAQPADHKVHPDLRALITEGVMQPTSTAFRLAFPDSSHPLLNDYPWSSYLLVTSDFATTITSHCYTIDDYLRPVNWILSFADKNRKFLIILSPYEVNDLLLEIKKSKAVRLHVYTPRTTPSMKSSEGLDFFTLPSHLSLPFVPARRVIHQLNLFAGQLYLQNYEAYKELCTFLGIICLDEKPSESVFVESDGFMKPVVPARRNIHDPCPFNSSPLPYVKELISSRRKGQGFWSTHLGQFLRPRVLIEADFD